MEKPGSTRNVGGIEENILAILGSSEAKDNQDAYEDNKSESSSSLPVLIVVEEAWFPFAFSSEIITNEKGAANNSGRPVDSYSFQLLIQELVDATGEANFQASEAKSLAKKLLFQYLINVLEWDFLPRNCIYKETTNWVVLRESLLNMLLVLDEPKWKLKIVVQYLWKYIAKPSIRTRRSNGPPDDDASFNGALKCFSNITGAKSTRKKIRTQVVQLLLAHGFQAHLSLPCENRLVGDASASDEETSSDLLVEICENIISAFKNMKAADKRMEISSLGKEALFTAATIVSAKS